MEQMPVRTKFQTLNEEKRTLLLIKINFVVFVEFKTLCCDVKEIECIEKIFIDCKLFTKSRILSTTKIFHLYYAKEYYI